MATSIFISKICIRVRSAFVILFAFLICGGKASAQYTPVTITGFNNDCVAETGTSSMATTTIPLDGVTVSNKVMYTNTFRTTNGFGGGGVPDNGLITSGTDNYQLAAYNANNVLLLQRGQNGDINIATPQGFTSIRVLAFSTEGTSLVNATLFFTDGTSTSVLTNYSLSDWFNGATNLVMQGFGRCTRATPTGGADAYPTNPRFYYIQINLTCAQQLKNLQKINFANVTTAGNNAPYPNVCLWAVSGRSFSQTITPTITAATCAGNNGSATLNVTGTTSPYTISWNTTPTQTGPTASNLAPGNYIATITDANACTNTYPVTITLQNTLTETVSKTDANCATNGSITITASGGSTYEYSINGGTTWQASNIFNNLSAGTYNVLTRTTTGPGCTTAPQSVTIVLNNNLTETVSKTDATCTTNGSITITASGGSTYEYSINGGTTWQASNTFNNLTPGTYNVLTRTTSGPGCTTAPQSVTIVLNNNLTMNSPSGASICPGNSFTPSVVSNATTFSWTPTTGVSNPAIANPVLSPTATITYTVTATLGTCSTTRSLTVTVLPGVTVNAGPDAAIIAGDSYQMQGSGSAGTYLWTPSTGLSSSTILNPIASPATTTTYTLQVTNVQGCSATDAMVLTVIPYCVKPMEAFTPNGDGINDRWLITNGNCLAKATASVFNRYGAKVFESQDYKNDWDGTYKGKPLPDGTYYFVISYQLINGKQVLLKGNVTILR